MSLICTECKNIFDYGEEKRWTEPHGEPLSGCPVCGGAYVEAEKCRFCFGEFLEDDLTNGYCDDCLRENITYDNFWLYITYRGLVADFMFARLFKSDVPAYVSPEFKNMMDLVYHLFANYERRFRKDDLMKLCESYVFDNDVNKYDFAEWLEYQQERGND